MYVLPACMSTYHMCSWVPADPEKGIKYPGTGGKDSWELCSGALQGQSLQPCSSLSCQPHHLFLPFWGLNSFSFSTKTKITLPQWLVLVISLSDGTASTLTSQFLHLLSSNNLIICFMCPRQPLCPYHHPCIHVTFPHVTLFCGLSWHWLENWLALKIRSWVRLLTSKGLFYWDKLGYFKASILKLVFNKICANISLLFKSVDCFLRDFGSKSENKYKAAYLYFTDCKCLTSSFSVLSALESLLYS